jgi:hypothetical protein
MTELLKDFPENTIAVLVKGHVTKEDYLQVFLPRVEELLKTHQRIRCYYEVDRDFQGYEPGAMWEDFMMGMHHPTVWEKSAIVTDVPWMRNAVNLFHFLLPRSLKLFSLDHAEAARDWIVQPSIEEVVDAYSC